MPGRGFEKSKSNDGREKESVSPRGGKQQPPDFTRKLMQERAVRTGDNKHGNSSNKQADSTHQRTSRENGSMTRSEYWNSLNDLRVKEKGLDELRNSAQGKQKWDIKRQGQSNPLNRELANRSKEVDSVRDKLIKPQEEHIGNIMHYGRAIQPTLGEHLQERKAQENPLPRKGDKVEWILGDSDTE